MCLHQMRCLQKIIPIKFQRHVYEVQQVEIYVMQIPSSHNSKHQSSNVAPLHQVNLVVKSKIPTADFLVYDSNDLMSQNKLMISIYRRYLKIQKMENTWQYLNPNALDYDSQKFPQHKFPLARLHGHMSGNKFLQASSILKCTHLLVI